METFSGKINALIGSSTEIAGLNKKNNIMMMIIREIAFGHFLVWRTDGSMNLLGACIARQQLLESFKGLARLSRRGWSRFLRGSREISSVPSLHRASTDALITRLNACIIGE